MNTANKKNLLKKIFFLFLALLCLFTVFAVVIDTLGSQVKKGIFYEAILNYNMDSEDPININDYQVVTSFFSEDYGLVPLDRKATPYIVYYYRFDKKTLFKSERIDNSRYIDTPYPYDSKLYVEKYNLQRIVYLYNLFGSNTDI